MKPRGARRPYLGGCCPGGTGAPWGEHSRVGRGQQRRALVHAVNSHDCGRGGRAGLIRGPGRRCRHRGPRRTGLCRTVGGGGGGARRGRGGGRRRAGCREGGPTGEDRQGKGPSHRKRRGANGCKGPQNLRGAEWDGRCQNTEELMGWKGHQT